MNKIVKDLYRTDIFRKYTDLSHVVYRTRYLIPQKYFAQKKLKDLFLRVHPQKKFAKDLAKEIFEVDFNKFLTNVKEKYYSQLRDHNTYLRHYFKKVIQPINGYEKKTIAVDLFSAENLEKVTKELESQGREMEKNTLLYQFQKLPAQKLKLYEGQALTQFKKFEKEAAKALIPRLDGKTPLDIYAQRQMKMTKIIPYSEQSHSEKDKLNKETEKYNE